MKFLKKLSTATAIAAALVVASTAQASVVIDLFTDPLPVGGQSVQDISVGGGGSFSEFDGLTSVIGGSRDLFVETLSQSAGGLATTMRAGGGFLSYSQESGVVGRGVVQWDGNDNSAALNTTGLASANLTNCGTAACEFFQATVIRADFGFGYSLTVVDMDGDRSVLTSSTQFPVSSPVTADYFFDWFNLGNGTYFLGGLLFDIQRFGAGSIDFSRIGALQFEINVPFGTVGTQADIDLTLSAIVTRVPEPGTLALVGLSLLGVAAASRGRKGAKS